MPNYNRALGGANSPNRKNSGTDAANAVMSDYSSSLPLDQQPLPVEEIELSKISLRPVNNYHPIDNLELDESIRQYGLINPIAVYHYQNDDHYVISAGARRFEAVSRLHERYPSNPRFQKIECKVYIITEDLTYLKQGFPYITKEQEEGIYRDSNNLARQLSEKDIASTIRYIVKRFDDPNYVARLKETAEQAGIKTYSNPDKTVLISSVMQTQGLWSNEKIRQYLIIYNTKNEDLLDAIENGSVSVNAAYKQVVDLQNRKRKRKTNKIQPLCKAVDALVLEAKLQGYSDKDMDKLRDCVAKLNSVIELKS